VQHEHRDRAVSSLVQTPEAEPHLDDVICVLRHYGHTVTSPVSISGSDGSSALFGSDGTSGCGVNACGGVRINSTARPISSNGAACSDRGGSQA